MNYTQLEKVQQRIERIGNLPTLPIVASKVLQLVHDPRSSMADVGKVIHNDLSLSTKVLQIANSPFYSLRQPVGMVDRALVVLGMEEIAQVVMAVSVFKAFPDPQGQATFDRERFWDHSAGCGHIVQLLARCLGCRLGGQEFIAGLVHDIGKIVLDQYLHAEFLNVLQLNQDRDLPMIEAERMVFGATHPEIGAWLLTKWRLPHEIVDSVRHHHDPARSEVHPSLVALVHIANLLCKASGMDFGEDHGGICLVESPAWGILASEKPEIGDLDIERFTFGLEDEIEHIREFIQTARK